MSGWAELRGEMDRVGVDRVWGDGQGWGRWTELAGDGQSCGEMDRGGERWVRVGGRNREVGTNGKAGTQI